MQDFDVIVVGAGHAGCEAAHAAARLGLRTALITMELAAIARMSCNPSIGGPAKGHLTREIDALGGLQGLVTDRTYVNLRMLNTGKGASVQALRAQSDRNAYSAYMRGVLAGTQNLTLIEGEVAQINTGLVQGQRSEVGGLHVGAHSVRPAHSELEAGRTLCAPTASVTGVTLTDGRVYKAERVVISPGTFTRAVCFMGSRTHRAGRWGESSADALGADLEQRGLPLRRLKTGTSPRIARDSVDYTKCDPQLSEWREDAFCNYAPSMLPAWFLPNWHTRTSDSTREIIQRHSHESALHSGLISGVGPRYCPSIEDKIAKFPETRVHPVFIEPDGLDVDILYLQGLSTSLPLEVQYMFLHSIPGLERAKIKRPGYAVEYDAVDPLDLDSALQSKRIAGLYCAGQFNGTSGYEEAAAQGLVAGANASLSLLGREALPLGRDNSYIGVLVDDLTTRGADEPYRMLTARAEHRLLLRHDNAALRLGPIARDFGLLNAEQTQALEALRQRVHAVQAELENTRLTVAQQQALGLPVRNNETIRGIEAIRRGASAQEVLNAECAVLNESQKAEGKGRLDSGEGLMANGEKSEHGSGDSALSTQHSAPAFLTRSAQRYIEVETQYEGYLERARLQVEAMREREHLRLPAELDFYAVPGLLSATRERLSAILPATLGQAMRVQGVTPADIAALHVWIRRATAHK
ncbi:tRNA uridine-5-carboxymethylaminomethyl(34) synthesis enzyme MnmG [bacterium]|nr:tRNA uridine-5-carboxymethylaminomethyl(34) synthesis enzyme MnmG [bacterium]